MIARARSGGMDEGEDKGEDEDEGKVIVLTQERGDGSEAIRRARHH